MKVSEVLKEVQEAYNKLDEAEGEIKRAKSSIDEAQELVRQASSTLWNIPGEMTDIEKEDDEESTTESET